MTLESTYLAMGHGGLMYSYPKQKQKQKKKRVEKNGQAAISVGVHNACMGCAMRVSLWTRWTLERQPWTMHTVRPYEKAQRPAARCHWPTGPQHGIAPHNSSLKKAVVKMREKRGCVATTGGPSAAPSTQRWFFSSLFSFLWLPQHVQVIQPNGDHLHVLDTRVLLSPFGVEGRG